MRPRIKPLVATTCDDERKKDIAQKNYLLLLQSGKKTSKLYVKILGEKQYITKDQIALYKQGNFEIFQE